jgi:hypothetical protein
MMKAVLVLCALLAACVPRATPAPTATPRAPSAPPGAGEWQTWSHEQKLGYMQSIFLPAERELFTSFEPVRYANLNCRTCHGAGDADGTYRMPNPDLPKLHGGAEGFGELRDHEPQALKFMQGEVVPTTARLLGLPAFDMAKHQGFSCFQCHTRADRLTSP